MPADDRAPGLVRAELTRWLVARNWPDEDFEDLVFAVSEAVSNAAEAGRELQKIASGRIARILVWRGDGEVFVTVRKQ